MAGRRRFGYIEVGLVRYQVCFADSIVSDLNDCCDFRRVSCGFLGRFRAEDGRGSQSHEKSPSADRPKRDPLAPIEHAAMLAKAKVMTSINLFQRLTKVTLERSSMA